MRDSAMAGDAIDQSESAATIKPKARGVLMFFLLLNSSMNNYVRRTVRVPDSRLFVSLLRRPPSRCRISPANLDSFIPEGDAVKKLLFMVILVSLTVTGGFAETAKTRLAIV